jgi:uncharacterized BrkB/YihY/UPF0761 family membrane protein
MVPSHPLDHDRRRDVHASSDQPPDHGATTETSRSDRARRRASSELEQAIERFPVVGSLLAATDRERAAGGVLLSGGVAYRLFFWLVPLGLLVAAVASIFTTGDTSGLDSAAEEHGLSGVAARASQQAIASSEHARWYLLGFGTVVTVWTGYGVVRALNIVFAIAWGERPPKVRRPPVAGAGFTIVAFVLSTMAWAVGVAVSWVGLGTLVEGVTTVLAYAGAALAVSLLFPHGDAPWRALVPGAVLISTGGIAVHVGVNVYLAPKLGRSVDTYGMLGASTVVLLWLYLIARLITVSAFLNATLWTSPDQREVPSSTRAPER